ncbi:MAG: ferric reductase-like transmembrane domain-containing protein [Planctomycetes bacterium]|nr:ferric reductase-like transmembrane domain-containing protein [Planctomycetota bacterium]MCB9910167.1 ferric reductase-like transmembrane domain-containing protein [Planctomycetota bacterium]HPF15318.1 ferric reductase-like transmembrane domain-containing protein [Planctomycetota bacterium]HRV81115.1 ferric reductase-like transmembrane domain-containing protein [Planctomycetota bacterium]
MSHGYVAVQWNRHKRMYDAWLVTGIVLYNVLFVGVTLLTHRPPEDVAPLAVIAMRSTSTCAFLMLHAILSIGPLARLSPHFAPLLYNRRHFGVATFCVGLAHGLLATLFYHGMGNGNALLGIFTDNLRYDSLAQFPFQVLGLLALGILFLMAATSHDFWLKNLGPGVWKALHMFVYLAYGLLVMHVALGALQSETNPAYVVAMGFGLVWVCGLHLLAGWREHQADGKPTQNGPWIEVGDFEQIQDGCARVVTPPLGERIAVVRQGQHVSALSNVCAHQGGPLGEGRVIDGCLTCPWHGYQYLADRGQSPPPFTEKVATYRTKIEGQRVFVDPTPLPPGTPVEPASVSRSHARA